MKQYLYALTLFLALAQVATQAQSINYPMSHKTLANGLKIIVCEKATNPMAEIQVWYRVGSKDEWAGVRGMAHMFEHMMFRGSKKFMGEGDVYIKELKKIGGSCNAYTTFDRTVYHEELPASNLEKAVEMEADRMENLVLTQKVLDTEREVVGEELRLGENNWFRRMMAERYKQFYPKAHPYEVDVIGYLEEITAFTTKQCQDFYDKFYSPNNAYIVVTGNVKASDVFAMVEKHFGGIKKQLPLNTKKQEPDIFKHSIPIEEMTIDYPLQIYGYIIPSPAFGHKDFYGYNLLSRLLFENSNSLLNQRLVNTNMAYQIVAQTDESRMYSNFSTYDVVMPAAIGNAKVRKAVSKEINEIINEGIEQSLIDNYIKNMETQYVFRNYSNSNIADALGYAEYYYNDYKQYEAEIIAYKKIKAEDLKAIAQTYFNPENLKIINSKPTAE